ncbi:MAG: glycosyltransferase family 2 protein [Hungatella sp.]|nr:glycosyltransferase family 2 protein [Hungatella sp.]
MENNDKISIIVPVYNNENCISRSVESLIKQSYSNLEILLIDDGSTDNSGRLCDKLESLDNRIRVFHMHNRGVSAARNSGLKLCTGEYVMFLDSDDFLELNACEEFYKAIKKYNVNIVRAMFNSIDKNGIPVVQEYCPNKDMLINVKLEYSFQADYDYGAVWSTLYRKDILKDIFFDEDLYVGEDTLFFCKALMRTDEILILNQRLYNYMIQDESAFFGTINEKKLTEIEARKRICSLLKKNKRLYASAKGAYGYRCLCKAANIFLHDAKELDDYYELCIGEYRKNFLNTIRHHKNNVRVYKLALYFIMPQIIFRFQKKKHNQHSITAQ